MHFNLMQKKMKYWLKTTILILIYNKIFFYNKSILIQILNITQKFKANMKIRI